MRAMPVLIVCALLLAGCADPSSTPAAVVSDEAAPVPSLNETLVAAGPSNDPWAPGETERVLFDGTVDAGHTCAVNNYLVLQPFVTALSGYVGSGCGVLFLDEAALVIPGSKTLRVEADATQSLKAGGYNVHFWSANRNTQAEAEGTPAQTPVNAFVFDLEPADWETAPPSTSTFWFWPQGAPANVLEGPIEARVVIERDPDWTPQALPDHWNMTGMHQVVEPGVMTLISTTMDWNEPSMVGGTFPTPPPLQGLIPSGTRFVVLAMAWTPMSNCPPAPAFGCRMFSDAYDGDRRVTSFGGPIKDASDSHTIIVWESPQQISWDPEGADASRIQIEPFSLIMCHVPLFETTCGRPPAGTSTTVRFVMEAWSKDVDLAAVAARLAAE